MPIPIDGQDYNLLPIVLTGRYITEKDKKEIINESTKCMDEWKIRAKNDGLLLYNRMLLNLIDCQPSQRHRIACECALVSIDDTLKSTKNECYDWYDYHRFVENAIKKIRTNKELGIRAYNGTCYDNR